MVNEDGIFEWGCNMVGIDLWGLDIGAGHPVGGKGRTMRVGFV